jgi:hypothetical protein
VGLEGDVLLLQRTTPRIHAGFATVKSLTFDAEEIVCTPGLRFAGQWVSARNLLPANCFRQSWAKRGPAQGGPHGTPRARLQLELPDHHNFLVGRSGCSCTT